MFDCVPEVRLPLAEIVVHINDGYLLLPRFAFQNCNILRHWNRLHQQVVRLVEIEIVNYIDQQQRPEDLLLLSSFNRGIELRFFDDTSAAKWK
jgi:hypothetical protein